MSTQKKKNKAAGKVKFGDLAAKKNPKGGFQKETSSASPLLYSALVTAPAQANLAITNINFTGAGASGGSGKG
jgi:hypothetical protein